MQRYSDTILNKNGRPVPGATVAVTNHPSGTPATIYAVAGGAPVASVVTNEHGRFAFYAIDGHYTLTISGQGIEQIVIEDVAVNDPANDVPLLSDYPTHAAAIAACTGKRLHVDGTANLVIPVSSVHAIQAAINGAAQWTIASTAWVTIQMADGLHQMGGTVLLDHPYNERMQLLGNQANEAACALRGTNPPTFDAFICSRGKFGLLDGFTIDLATKATHTANFTAVLALPGGGIVCGPNMTVNNWYYGMVARSGSYLFARYARVDNAGDVGIWAETGSTVDCQFAHSTNASDTVNNLGFCFQAEHGSNMDCSNAIASGGYIAGIASLSGSSVRAWGATSSNNTGSGFYAFGNAVIEAHNATANNNGRYGIEETDAARVFGSNITRTGNTLGATKGRAHFDNTTLGARLVADGDFRVDLSGTGSWFFNSSGGLQMRINHTANAVNRWAMTGSVTGAALVLLADGTDTTIHGAIKPKGAGGQAQLQSANGTVKVAANDTGIGFHGTTPVAKPAVTGARGGNAALASLLTNLAATGLITDSTTA